MKDNTCPKCGAILNNNKCEYCGYKLTDDSVLGTIKQTISDVASTAKQSIDDHEEKLKQNPQGKSKWITLLLCVFAGIWGVHRFYLGKILSGLMFLFTAGFFGFGWIIDIVRILTNTLKDVFGRDLIA